MRCVRAFCVCAWCFCVCVYVFCVNASVCLMCWIFFVFFDVTFISYQERFPLIIAADVIYDKEHTDLLFEVFKQCLARTPHASMLHVSALTIINTSKRNLGVYFSSRTHTDANRCALTRQNAAHARINALTRTCKDVFAKYWLRYNYQKFISFCRTKTFALVWLNSKKLSEWTLVNLLLLPQSANVISYVQEEQSISRCNRTNKTRIPEIDSLIIHCVGKLLINTTFRLVVCYTPFIGYFASSRNRWQYAARWREVCGIEPSGFSFSARLVTHLVHLGACPASYLKRS